LMHNTHIHGPNIELLHEFLSYKIDTEIVKFYIAEAKPKHYHLAIQGPASALRSEVLDCCSHGRLPSLFPLLGLTTGPHPLATAVTKP
jgi:hypothetical protein